jgi:hypothetical protein
VDAIFADLTCTVAINILGAAQLIKAKKDNTQIGRCLTNEKVKSIICHNNICSIIE